MTRTFIIFVSAALLGAVVTLVVRSALHRPYEPMPTTSMSSPMHEEHAPLSPASAPASSPASSPTADPHAGHTSTTPALPVNTICAICGMDVDHDLPTTIYRNQVIGFACAKCPPTFAKDPERYGPAYLRNEKLRPEAKP